MEVKNNTEWEIDDLGICDEYVYDIETENHMFFANNILVHNSNYMDMTDILNKYYESHPDANIQDATDFLDKYCKMVEEKCLNPTFDRVKYECNGYSGGGLHMDREAICVPYKKTGYSALWTAKKRYIAMVSDMEDFRYEEPHMKIMGMFSVTSTCPEFIKPVYNEVLVNLIKDGIDVARETINKFKPVFYSKSIGEIAFPKSVTDVSRYTDPSTGLPWNGIWYDQKMDKQRNGGVPINAKSAVYYNYLLNKFDISNKYQKIKDGDKMKFVYLKENPYHFSVIGFHDEMPKEFNLDEYVDYDTHWEKLFYSPINDIFTACGLTIEDIKRIDDFF